LSGFWQGLEKKGEEERERTGVSKEIVLATQKLITHDSIRVDSCDFVVPLLKLLTCRLYK
jgi:hypothetical protein